MDYEDQEELEGQVGSGPSYKNSLVNSNSTRALIKFPSSMNLPPPPPPQRKSRYKECLKNQAVGIGGHSVDGCCEFLPAGEEGSIESLKCAACNCHRNFHRKENDASASAFGGGFHHNQILTHHPHRYFGYRTPSGYLHVAQPHQRVADAPLALPSNSGGGLRDDQKEDYYSNPSSSGGQKRFRTKFTQEQKDKMLNLAVRLDWKIQKQDEEFVQQFCSEVGIRRHVLKVWMHNNKQTLGKKT